MTEKKTLSTTKTSFSPNISPTNYEVVADLFKSISDPTRVRIVTLLQHKSMRVNDIAAALNMSQSSISHQLRILRNYRIVTGKRQGREIMYHLIDHHIASMLDQAIKHTSEAEF